MLKIERLNKQYPPSTTVLRNVFADIHNGEFIGIVGASGSGKSTLLKCLALQESWTSGKYTIDGTDIFKLGSSGKSKVKRECAYLEQNPVLSSNRKALKNVLIGRAHQTPLWRMVTGMIRNDDYMGAMDTLEQLGLLDKAHMITSNLSGGEKQRVAIARALVHGAKVILADEPVLGLDPKSAESVLSTFKDLCEREQCTVIAVFHQVELAEKYCSRIWGLADGEIKVDIRGRRLLHGEKMKLSL
ncbi:ATP-binding cassette domain-containing protein [Paenibacillus sp. ACRRX]|uniref:phosphonate ABC transporter ATP-binding protein n=1 Tax=unclassified Paenibacillus TaxID=185978 RepID=UPI001EF5ADBB|nr:MULTISPECIES: ATP-binding cassette domain-containing protein [unclassified Paenibacillus]MCG7407127.1 ATP-binding cassette domain-containing protein [Paenibacillus sp. ACRRX]MDK8180347.1 ATP-binding cassette domain-containing protein [Paenibacillus sp. UMB4589-SE434]